MTGSVPLWRHATYRLCHLWRVLLIVPTLVALGAAFAGQVGGLHSLYLHPEAILRTTAIAAGITALVVVLLPASTFEHLTMGLIAAGFVAAEPWLGLLFQPNQKGGDFMPIWVRAMILGLAAYLAWLSLIFIWSQIALRLPPRNRPYRYGLTVPNTDPETLRAAMAMRENATVGLVTFGARAWDGFVPARLPVRAHDAETGKMCDQQIEYRVKHLGETAEGSSYVIDLGDGLLREVSMDIRPHRRGARIEVEERPGPPDRIAAVTQWLGRAGEDLLRARTDAALDRPSPAIFLCPQRSLLLMVLALMRFPSPTPKPAEPDPS